jgi:hypothetical protein
MIIIGKLLKNKKYMVPPKEVEEDVLQEHIIYNAPVAVM